MPAKTTVKVATLNNAAKDDYFGNLDFMAEDHELAGFLNVLGNDPGSAKLIGVSQYLPTNGGHLVNTGSSFTPDGFTASISVTLAGGQLYIDASALNTELQSLGEGDTRSITFYYTAQMANGAYSTAKVTIDIQGENDDPTFGASGLAGAVTDTADDDDYSAVIGTVTASDVDTNDAGLLVFGLADGEDGLSDYGTFTIDSDGDWTFTPDDSAVEGLKTTENVEFDIVVEDGHGGSATQTVTITLNGVNDAPEFSGDDSGEVTEDGTTTTGGTLAVADRDTADLGFQAATSALAGTYGDFTFTAATGEWTYTLRNGDANVQALGDDDHPTDTLTVHSADGTAHTITVTVNGAAEPAPSYVTPAAYTGSGDSKDFDSTGDDNSGSGTPGNDQIRGTAGGDTISGGVGNDTIYSGAGDDGVTSGPATQPPAPPPNVQDNDTVYGGSGNDTIVGGYGNDNLYGGSGTDTIDGASGNDNIWGGFGADALTGGAGGDTFAYLDQRDTGDTISDFASGDKIDLTALGVTAFLAAPLAAAGAVGAHQAGYMTSGGVTTIYVDTDGVFGADLEIILSNAYMPTAADFILAP